MACLILEREQGVEMMERMFRWEHLANRLSYQTVLGRMLRIPLRLLPEAATVRVLSGLNKGCKWIVGPAFTAVGLSILSRKSKRS